LTELGAGLEAGLEADLFRRGQGEGEWEGGKGMFHDNTANKQSLPDSLPARGFTSTSDSFTIHLVVLGSPPMSACFDRLHPLIQLTIQTLHSTLTNLHHILSIVA
jgi:hypothetical protein